MNTDISVDSRHQTLQGLMFPLDENVIEILNSFKEQNVDYVQLVREKLKCKCNFENLHILKRYID
jgi:hypothetical protein